ncbi:hypothetical protein J4457_06690 [Candidatus Woesearchaeota archaeon]|nr:hypothetical protein [Candidatus Woesearchaeota archaeon]
MIKLFKSKKAQEDTGLPINVILAVIAFAVLFGILIYIAMKYWGKLG